MRFDNYLAEYVKMADGVYGRKGDLLLDSIKRNCKNFTRESKGNLIWRGVASGLSGQLYQLREPRIIRQPRDVPKSLHIAFDNAFKKIFGWNARSRGIFTTSNSHNAESYGMLAIFVPIGNYKFIYSSSVEDLMEIVDNDFPDWKIYKQKELYDACLNVVKKKYTDKNLIKAIQTGVEISFTCHHYYVIDPEFGVRYKKEFQK